MKKTVYEVLEGLRMDQAHILHSFQEMGPAFIGSVAVMDERVKALTYVMENMPVLMGEAKV